MMKKYIMIGVLAAVLAIAIFGVRSALAQGGRPPSGGMMMGGGKGWMHEYVAEALAEKLGLTEEEVEEAFASGNNMFQIAQEAGTAESDIPALLTEVHKTAFDKAVAAGVLTRQQAEWMLQRMQANPASLGTWNCPMMGSGPMWNNGSGFRGGMHGNW